MSYDRRGPSASGSATGSISDDVADPAVLIKHLDRGRTHVFGACSVIPLWLASRRPDLVPSGATHEPAGFGVPTRRARAAAGRGDDTASHPRRPARGRRRDVLRAGRRRPHRRCSPAADGRCTARRSGTTRHPPVGGSHQDQGLNRDPEPGAAGRYRRIVRARHWPRRSRWIGPPNAWVRAANRATLMSLAGQRGRFGLLTPRVYS